MMRCVKVVLFLVLLILIANPGNAQTRVSTKSPLVPIKLKEVNAFVFPALYGEPYRGHSHSIGFTLRNEDQLTLEGRYEHPNDGISRTRRMEMMLVARGDFNGDFTRVTVDCSATLGGPITSRRVSQCNPHRQFCDVFIPIDTENSTTYPNYTRYERTASSCHDVTVKFDKENKGESHIIEFVIQ